MANPSSADEENFKRNTDCVYFLASPLTCKKGNECEYRHSEVARVNPRDCWFWLHGNCLNPKCGFRHPPLEGLLGAQTPTTTGHSLTPSQDSEIPTSNVPNTFSKQAAPCIFFQKGFCLKGDWCPFLHVPNFTGNKATLVSGTTGLAEPPTSKAALGGHEKFSHEKQVPMVDTMNSVTVPHPVKMPIATKTAHPKNEFSVSRDIPHSSAVNELLIYPTTSNSVLQPHRLGETGAMNTKYAEEVSREPSPGFDVLVDDELRDADYYPNKDQYRMDEEHEDGDEYDIDPTSDYNMIADIDSERFQDYLGYGLHEIRKGRHGLELHRTSSEKMPGGGYLERRPYARANRVNRVDEVDLRHRLNKRRKNSGLRSVISHEHVGFHGERQNISLHEDSLSNQLRGRIKLPVRSSSPTEQDSILGPKHGRLSPTRTNSSYQGRIQDRIKGREVGEHFHNGVKIHQGLHFHRDKSDDNTSNFTGPKSLAELKNQKNTQPNLQSEANQQPLGKRKNHIIPDDVSFEGPRPLEEILKRKRSETLGISSGKKSSDKEGIIADNTGEEDNCMTKISKTSSNIVTMASNNTMVNPVRINESVSDASLHIIPRTSQAENDDAIVEVGKDGESDYEQEGGENYDLYDTGNIDDPEEDEDDDFAKKMGVMYS